MYEDKLESRTIPLRQKIRHVGAKIAARIEPSLFALLAKPANGVSVRIRSRANHIELIAGHRIIRLRSDQHVYLPAVVKNFQFYFDAVWSDADAVDGAMFDIVDYTTSRLQRVRGFDHFPLHCPGLIEPIATTRQYLDFARLKPGMVVIDAGAHIGLTSIAFANEVGASGRVLAIEPDPQTLVSCKINLTNAACPNIALFEMALAPSVGRIKFSSEAALGSAFASLVGYHRGEVVEVETTTLDELAHRQGLDQVDFIKLDIEGAEAWVVPAAVRFLSRYRPKLIIEPHRVDGRSTAPRLISVLADLGYRCELMHQHQRGTLPLLAATP